MLAQNIVTNDLSKKQIFEARKVNASVAIDEAQDLFEVDLIAKANRFYNFTVSTKRLQSQRYLGKQSAVTSDGEDI